MGQNHQYILLLGGNLGGVKETFISAINKLNTLGKVTKSSSLYQSEPWGFEDENLFLNQAVALESSLSPADLMTHLLKIERELGRERNVVHAGYQSRLIDIDQLACDEIVSKDDHITLPHPSLHLRKFALLPLQELLPNWIHPVSKKSVSELISACNDSSEIQVV